MIDERSRNMDDRLAEAARKAADRDEDIRKNPEPSLGARLGQIGLLGWTIVVPALLGLFAGRWLDKTMATGVFFSAPLVMIGAGAGLWFAWKWMSRP